MTDKSAREIIAERLCRWEDQFEWKHQPSYYQEADFILAALEAGGFAVVPKEPTPEMLRRMEAAQCFSTGCSTCGSAQDCYDVNARYEPDIAGAGAAWKAGILAASNPKEEGSDN